MPKDAEFHYLHKAVRKLGYTVFSICDSHLITGDHRILIGCNTFLQEFKASSRDITTIKNNQNIFTCMQVVYCHITILF